MYESKEIEYYHNIAEGGSQSLILCPFLVITHSIGGSGDHIGREVITAAGPSH